ncbi:hypothetical protein MATR_19530 [Marivirga tractuosa]|uniref:Uncharacterized protein n=1 Tax=Marivirga tractuosa (strain ATCC 23168 / DSM 4126 / NBRC 15989 / NCIMB 1408 / VKM B-1430 / H-43) TaxID=643867 RepID=E4TNH0_MARTH|nr:hypothetical protein [Marivirga tractuosa]ADR20427.1 hypothetical protein Ftrac_0421 [Marivirga tractuosa DSM 4126]BDD15128.1 hypothetical protein MATR_19530 [Marivirga tractuosa]
MIEFRNPYYIIPPGSNKQILSHPKERNGVVELAVFQEHRYAFFYWLKWSIKHKTTNPPCLVTLDWHQDLCSPCSTEKKWLSQLDLSNDGEIALFSWSKLAGNNDGQILSAAYLNLIGNIYVYCRQGAFERDWQDEEFVDINGNIHYIKKFKTQSGLEQHLLATSETKVYFDIDLDFFTINNPYNGKGKSFTYMTRNEIVNLLSVKNPLIQWIFSRLSGFTIATEPEHCGGLLKSNRLLDIINRNYFKPDLFTQKCEWRHKT